MFATLFAKFPPLLAELPLLLAAKAQSTPSGPGSKSGGLCWAIVLFCVILGLLVSLNPSKRTTEIKRPDA